MNLRRIAQRFFIFQNSLNRGRKVPKNAPLITSYIQFHCEASLLVQKKYLNKVPVGFKIQPYGFLWSVSYKKLVYSFRHDFLNVYTSWCRTMWMYRCRALVVFRFCSIKLWLQLDLERKILYFSIFSSGVGAYHILDRGIFGFLCSVKILVSEGRDTAKNDANIENRPGKMNPFHWGFWGFLRKMYLLRNSGDLVDF